jgi:hypothetical protein
LEGLEGGERREAREEGRRRGEGREEEGDWYPALRVASDKEFSLSGSSLTG